MNRLYDQNPNGLPIYIYFFKYFKVRLANHSILQEHCLWSLLIIVDYPKWVLSRDILDGILACDPLDHPDKKSIDLIELTNCVLWSRHKEDVPYGRVKADIGHT